MKTISILIPFVGLLSALTASAAVHYVDVNGTNPAPPYTNWSTAAVVIQDAIDAAAGGDTVLVTNGVYSVGSRAMPSGSVSNRVVLSKPLVVQSVNGPTVTVIQGYQVPGTITGVSAVRCAWVDALAVLSGFTLTNGATMPLAYGEDGSNGGGVYCPAIYLGSVTNCIITGNVADFQGGGAAYGILTDCTISNNYASVQGGGVFLSSVNNCLIFSNSTGGSGGGSSGCTMNGCRIIGNHGGGGGGGGADRDILNNCELTGNSGYNGGGAYAGILKNCTIVGNFATNQGGGVDGGGPLNTCIIDNCIIYGNTCTNGANWIAGTNYNNCCTMPLPTGGVGNFTNAPHFIDEFGGNLRLQANSPCINGGNNQYAYGAIDLDGLPRIVGGTVDVGAYEFQSPTSIISYAWLQQYGLPTDGSADYTDTDGDGMNNWQEWICDTDPTNAASVLRMLSPTSDASGISVPWQSVSDRNYFLQRSTDLSGQQSFLTIATNIAGTSDTTTFTDTNATGNGPFFYRVGIQR